MTTAISSFTHTGASQEKLEPLAFEVASIKLNTSGDRVFGTKFLPGGRFSAKNVPLGLLVLEAYNVSPALISFGPEMRKLQKDDSRAFSELMNRRYDIEAVAEKGSLQDDSAKLRNEKLRLMLQTLLTDRFKMVVRRESKEQPVYAIVVGKGGPKLQNAEIQEEHCIERPTDPLDLASCHTFQAVGWPNGVHGQAVDISDLARALSGFSDRPIIDQTGLKGLYNIQTSGWVDLRNLVRPPSSGGPDPRPEDSLFNDPSRPTLFAVLEELGLKLQAETASVEALVIEHIQPLVEK
jgi:uncharacterized protein (TIGR03435 family)